MHFILPQSWPHSPGHGWPQTRVLSHRFSHFAALGSSLQAISLEWFPAQLRCLNIITEHLKLLQSSKHLPGHLCPQDNVSVQLLEQILCDTSSEQRKVFQCFPQANFFSILTAHLKLEQFSPHFPGQGWLHERFFPQGASQNAFSVWNEHFICFSWLQGNFLVTISSHGSPCSPRLTLAHTISFLCKQGRVISTSFWQQYSSGFL